MAHEPKRTKTILDAYIDDAFIDKAFLCADVRAGSESAAMNHDKYGKFLVDALRRSSHAKVKAILTHGYVATALIRVGNLRRTVSPLVSLIHSCPRFLLHRSFPA